jgi:putative tryptophan/tyrosine transport system substrate-binding protein
MRRRDFTLLLGGGALILPSALRAQQQRPYAVGLLSSQALPPIQRFVRKLRDYGYVEGENLRLHARYAEGRDERYPGLAAELVNIPVDLIVAQGTPAALAAKRATTSISIIVGGSADPVSAGIVPNLARPGGNITGFSTQNVDLEGKRLELLKDLVPQLARVGVLANVANPVLVAQLENVRSTAVALRVKVEVFEVRSTTEVSSALENLQTARPDGVVVTADFLLMSKRTEIVTALTNARLPAVYPFREYASVGGLAMLGPDVGALLERVAGYVDKILKGAKPGELPVQLATQFELIMNLKAAATIGLAIPPVLVARADEVME